MDGYVDGWMNLHHVHSSPRILKTGLSTKQLNRAHFGEELAQSRKFILGAFPGEPVVLVPHALSLTPEKSPPWGSLDGSVV